MHHGIIIIITNTNTREVDAHDSYCADQRAQSQ